MLHDVVAAPPFADKGTADAYCGKPVSVGCRLVWDITQSQSATSWFHNWLDGGPVLGILKIVLTIVVALVLRRIAHQVITKITTRMAEATTPEKLRERTRTIFDGNPILLSERGRQRAKTVGSVLRSIASIVILGTAALTVLSYVGLNLAPVLASASIVGVAVGFGAQNLVKDFITGIFMLLEDQYGVGDVIDVGPAKGTVEAVSLRTTRLRDDNGVVWYIRNGEISRVGNESQNWARAVLDVPVAYDEDVDKVRDLLKDTAFGLAAESPWDEIILEEPAVWGVQSLTSEAVVVRTVLKTAPGRQGDVARELRERIKKAFDNAGVSVANFTEA